MRKGRMEVAAWLVGCASAGVGAMTLARATAAPQTDGDWFDSDLFIPVTVGLALVTMAAGYRAPRAALVFGIAGGLPYIAAVLGIGFSRTPEQASFMPLAFAFTLPYALIPVITAESGSYRYRRRVGEAKATSPES